MPELNLSGAVAVVTGASRSIGRAVSVALAEAGATVALVGRDTRALDAVSREISAVPASKPALPVPCDVSDVAAVESAIGHCAKAIGTPDILVANAGIFQQWMPSEDLPLDEWDQVMAVDLRGLLACCRAAGRLMLERGSGCIVTVSSIAGVESLPRMAAYNAAKAGVVSLTKTLAVEWAGRGVRVNCVVPGYIERDVEPLKDDQATFRDIQEQTPLGRFGRPREVAMAVLYLASDMSSFVVGSTLVVDGGWTAA
ncbi:MAG: SDR family NAD(P)-dependent oxidoreductase [Streptosporangiaceae bacterium]